jgi:crotonobetainyl-CoA:carnitine CoA-transferase CaiB-like acyl-CoA transferase
MQPTPRDIFADLWHLVGFDPAALDQVDLSGAEPFWPSSFRVGAAAQASVAASALAAAEIWWLRGGSRQRVSVDLAHASADFLSENFCRIEGQESGDLWNKIAGAYECGDGRWVRLHTNFPHHRDGVLHLLGCAEEREAVATKLRAWKAEDFETAATDAGLVVAMMRSFAEWDAHPHGRALARHPVIGIERIGDAPAEGLAKAERPLSGVKVLDLTRVIAGPVCGRTLAAHGADVLNISGPHLPSFPLLVMDTGRGKRTAHVDLRAEEGRTRLRGLIAGADVFVQGYRPGGLAGHGFTPAAVAAIRPGIVYVTLSAYGAPGPWSGKRGFDSLVQTATGFNHAEAEAAGSTTPKPLPCQALDHGSGYLMALGALAGIARRMREGGSWHVTVSLARTGLWLRDLGRRPQDLAAAKPGDERFSPFFETTESGFGRMTALRHSAVLERTPAHWERPSMPLGVHPASWA